MSPEKLKGFNQIEEQLNLFHRLPVSRDPRRANQTKSRFLAEVRQASVTFKPNPRHTFHNNFQRLFGTGKDGRKMTTALVTVVTALVLFFGGGTATVYASQNSLPNEFLYPVKLASEDFRSYLINSPTDRIDLELSLSDTRLHEALTLLEEGQIPDETQYVRLETHMNTALNLAVANKTVNKGELQKLQNKLQEQSRMMEQLQTGTNETAAQSQARLKAMLQTQNTRVEEWVNVGEESNSDTNGTQDQSRDQFQDQTQDQTQDQNRDQTQDQTQDQNRDQTQDQSQDQNHDQTQQQLNTNNCTPTPPATLVPSGNNQNSGYENNSYSSGSSGNSSGYSSGTSTGSTGDIGSGNGSGNSGNNGGSGKGK